MEKGDAPQKKTTRRASNKVRVRLPTIESYEKTLEFPAEGPGRVVVRLERLMGSDRIRITDPKYLSTLVERLEAEESKSWGSRSRLRKKAEKNRSRQLAIEGLMEPAEDMLDLYEHPVFRVNRVLNRLALFDTNISGGNPQKMPPIVEVDLFTPEDDTGKVFKTYPQHQVFHKQILPYAETKYSLRRSTVSRQSASHGALSSRQSASPGSVHSLHSQRAAGSMAPSAHRMARKRRIRPGKNAKSTKSLYRASKKPSSTSVKPSEMEVNVQSKSSVKVTDASSKEVKTLSTDKSKQLKGTTSSKSKQSEDGSGDDEGVDNEDKDSDADTKRGKDAQLEMDENSESLQDFMLAYGVPSDQNLIQDWQAFKSHLVERVYEETGGSSVELYELAGHVIGTYDRQLDLVDEFVETRESTVREERKKMGLPSDPKLVAKILMEARDKKDEDDGDGGDDNDKDNGGEGDEEDDDDADKHYKSWSKKTSKASATMDEESESKGNLRSSKSKSTVGGESKSKAVSSIKSKSNLSKSKSRTVVDGEGEDDEEEEVEGGDEEEEEEEEEGIGEIGVGVSKTQESLAEQDEEEAEENEDGGEEEANDEEENENE